MWSSLFLPTRHLFAPWTPGPGDARGARSSVHSVSRWRAWPHTTNLTREVCVCAHSTNSRRGDGEPFGIMACTWVWTRVLVAVGVVSVVGAADPGSTCTAWCRNNTAMGLFGSYIPPCLAALNNSEVSGQTRGLPTPKLCMSPSSFNILKTEKRVFVLCFVYA